MKDPSNDMKESTRRGGVISLLFPSHYAVKRTLDAGDLSESRGCGNAVLSTGALGRLMAAVVVGHWKKLAVA